MDSLLKILPAVFYRTISGNEPVREWLKGFDKKDRLIIGQDIKMVEFGWPVGMPVCRSMSGHKNLWEIRSKLTHGRIARVLFFVYNGKMVLLHGFVKKSQKTPDNDLSLAIKRKREYEKACKKST